MSRYASGGGERKKSKLPKVVSHDEARRLLDAIQEDWKVSPAEGLRNRLMVALLYRAGLRVSEVVGIQERDISDDGLIRLYAAKGGDGTAYFDPATIRPLLQRWQEIRRAWEVDEPGISFFCKQDGTPISVRYLQRLVKRKKEELGIIGIVTPHVFRHTYATELIEEGTPIHEVQGAMRHANIQTTEVYLHLRDESLRRRITSRGGSQ